MNEFYKILINMQLYFAEIANCNSNNTITPHTMFQKFRCDYLVITQYTRYYVIIIYIHQVITHSTNTFYNANLLYILYYLLIYV